MNRRKLDYWSIWNDMTNNRLTQVEAAKKFGAAKETISRIQCIGDAFAQHYEVKKEGIAAYQPRELMQQLASLGYRGKLYYTQEIDIAKTL